MGESQKLLQGGTQNQLDFSRFSFMTFITSLAMVWPGLLAGQSSLPRTSYIICGVQCKMNMLDFCFKKILSRWWLQSINQPWAALGRGLFVTAQVLYPWSLPCPSWLKVLLNGKHSDNTLKYPYLIHLYSPGELVNVLFIMGAWWILTNGLLLTEAIPGAPERMKPLR